MRGSDLKGRGIKTIISLSGDVILPLCFCFQAFAAAEELYNDVFEKEGDIGDIFDAWAEGSLAAVLSLIYGAAVAANSDIDFTTFAKATADSETRKTLNETLADYLPKAFRDVAGGGSVAMNAANEFQWDEYYKWALHLGMSEAEFWAATPRKIWLLTRDKEQEERSVAISNKYV